jgi:hypothetical protein
MPPVDAHPSALWERILAAIAAVTIFGLVAFLVIRNQPFSDPNFAVFVRILLAFSTAVLGATIPGALRVDWSAKGVAIRATGAVGFFLLTYFFTPSIASSAQKPNVTAPSSTTHRVDAAQSDELHARLHIPSSERIVFSPYTVYFGAIEDNGGLYPDYSVTPGVRKIVQQSADWINSQGTSVKYVELYSNVDATNSAEFAMATSMEGGNTVKRLLVQDGIDGELIHVIADGKENALQLFVNPTGGTLWKDYNNYVAIAIGLGTCFRWGDLIWREPGTSRAGRVTSRRMHRWLAPVR